MKRFKTFIVFVVFGFASLSAQSSLQQVLIGVETNNKSLKAARQSAEVQKLDARIGISLPDPSIDYDYMWGNKAASYGQQSEMKVVQEFDFPTSYYQRNKVKNLKLSQADAQYMVSRQDILLETKLLCVELVYFNKIKSILSQRLNNAFDLNKSYQKRLQVGDANILEANKIALELLNVQTEYRLNEVEISNRLQKLSELNGGVAVSFTDTSYFSVPNLVSVDLIIQKSLERDPVLANQRKQSDIAHKSVSLAKSMMLPKLSVGYRMNIASPERFYGVHAGITIPLWENRNTVKKARAEAVLAGMEIDNSILEQTNSIRQLYDKSIALKKSVDDYMQLLSTQNNATLLNKALSLGQISLLEYLTELNFLYQSTENYLQTERDYYLAITELLKVEL